MKTKSEMGVALRVTEFTSAKDFLCALFAAKKQKNPLFSLRGWARHLGLASPSLLSAVLRGDRSLSPKLCHRLATSFDLSNEDREYFLLLSLISSIEETQRAPFLRALQSWTRKSSAAP